MIARIRRALDACRGNYALYARIAHVDDKSIQRILDPKTPAMEAPTIERILTGADIILGPRSVQHVVSPSVRLDEFISQFDPDVQPKLTKIEALVEPTPIVEPAPVVAVTPVEQPKKTRTCRACRVEKLLDFPNFYHEARDPEGFRTECRDCTLKRNIAFQVERNRLHLEKKSDRYKHVTPDVEPPPNGSSVDKPILVTLAPPVVKVDAEKLQALVDRVNVVSDALVTLAIECEALTKDIAALQS
jgi:hypothetical protein